MGSLSHSLSTRLIGFGKNSFGKGEQNVHAARVFRAVGVIFTWFFVKNAFEK